MRRVQGLRADLLRVHEHRVARHGVVDGGLTVMYFFKRHALACNASHCLSKGANDVVGRLRIEIIRRGLDSTILVNNCGTIDLCDIGPNIVVYPDNVILSGVTLKDVKRVADYLAGGPIPEDLVLDRDTPAEAARHDLYAAAVAGSVESGEAFAALADDHGLDERWVSEQQRRGFIARKPDVDRVEVVVVTNKARTRYGLPLTARVAP